VDPPYLDRDLLIEETSALHEITRLEQAAGELDAAGGHYPRYVEYCRALLVALG